MPLVAFGFPTGMYEVFVRLDFVAKSQRFVNSSNLLEQPQDGELSWTRNIQSCTRLSPITHLMLRVIPPKIHFKTSNPDSGARLCGATFSMLQYLLYVLAPRIAYKPIVSLWSMHKVFIAAKLGRYSGE